MRIAMEFKVPARIRKKGKWFISSCPLLDVHSQGHTRDEAEHNLVDALAAFLISCYERGTLGQVLRDCGFVPVAEARAPETVLRKGDIELTVPLPFVIESSRTRVLAS
jgi:predicted RNase H-like HicB family nuclease